MEPHQHKYIQKHLRNLEEKHDIKIILAIESGSRAWGFPSKDSDFDVRFIYVHKLEHYLSIEKQRDVIDTPIKFDPVLDAEFDMNGWDIKKAIHLASRGNSVVNEWLTSPIEYLSSPELREELKKFVTECADLRAYFYFYRNYMRTPWESYSQTDDTLIKIKYYCYSLRCALAIYWIEQRETPPPMDVPNLLAGLNISSEIRSEINKLIAAKQQSTESDTIARTPILDNFIDNAISSDAKRPKKDDMQKHNLEKANELFRKIIFSQ